MNSFDATQKGKGHQPALRIVSLIPSATEIVASLGYGQYLVGRSHECDYPSFVQSLPICTEPKFNPIGTSKEIHDRVTDLLTSALSVYHVKTEILADLRPTHIITQAQCEVCAVSLKDVEQAVTDLVATNGSNNGSNNGLDDGSDYSQGIQLVSLQPEHLADVWTDMSRVAKALDRSLESEQLATNTINQLKSRIVPLDYQPRPTVACIEWTEPLMAAGNWVPELVQLAGGDDCFGKAGAHSDWLSWAELLNANPDIIVVMPCGYDLDQTRQAATEMAAHAEWHQLDAVKHKRVYVSDGNQYFNRPGPRLVESYEILVEIIQAQRANHTRIPTHVPTHIPEGWEIF